MINLYKHQKVALSCLRTNDSFALFMEQGTGKTIPAIKRVLELYTGGKIKNALIIAPKAVMGSWWRDVEKFEPEEQKKLLEVMTVVNYDKVWRGDKNSPFYKQWDVIILDEAHYIKNRTSKRSEFILKLATKAKYKYLLTGTPIGNGQLENIWSLYAFLDPVINSRGRIESVIFGGTYPRFQDRYCVLNKYFQPSSYVHVEELQDIIAEHCYRVKKEECLDLPEKLPDEILEVDLQEKDLYNRLLKKSALVEFDILADNPLSRMVKLRQLLSGFITMNDKSIMEVKTEKIKALEGFLEGYEKKLVIFAEFKQSIKNISELLKKKKIKHVILDGDQKDKMIWRKFQQDESIRIIICQYQSGAAGIDLFAADTILYYEPTTRSTTLEQSRDRIHRSGQTQKCSYIHMITKGTIEMEIFKTLQKYGDFSEKVFVEYMNTYIRSYVK